jgi:branched-chain amino acid transport system substrate-binding protein
VFGDHQGKQEVAISEVERLIQQEKVSVVGGAQLSGIVVAATTVTERLQVPFVVDVPAAAPITERGFKYVFRTNINGRTYGKTFVALIKDLNAQGANIKKVALVYPDTEAAKSFLGAAGQEARAAGLDVVFDEAFPLDMQDFTTLLTRVKVKSPDIVGTNDNHVSQAIQLWKQAADIRLKPKLLVSANGSAEFPDFAAGMGKLKDGFSLMVQWNPDLAGAGKVADEFYNKYKEILNGHGALGIQAAYVVAEALELAKSTDPKVIRDALAKLQINPGPRLIMPWPYIRFDETGQNTGARCIVVQWQGEQRSTVYPKESAIKKIIVPFDYWSSK